jgi:hypothetical protein
MALEVIGGIASIAQLAGTVYTLSKTLYEVSESLSNASAEITDLARDLETFAEELNLLSTLLHGKDGRYADRIYRLTAKIIGDCATICLKIDRIIRKSRRGSVWGKVKWLYKEKEILKLLARLRDLKLSLMSTLSVLSALRADYMMDSLGIQHASLLGGPKDQGISDETMKEVEETKAKLASISLNNNPNICTSKPTTKANPSNPSSHAGGSSLTLTSCSTLTSSSITPTSSSSIASGTIGDLGTGVPPFMSNVLMPGSIPMQNLRALESVDSFHSAISHLDDDDGGSSALAGEARGAAPASCVQSDFLPLASYRPQNYICHSIHNLGSGGKNTAPIASSSSASQADPVLVALMAGGRRPDIARNVGDKALPSDEEDEESPTQNLPDPDPSRPIFLQPQNVAVSDNDGSNDSIAKQQEAVTVWREEMIISAIKNIGMTREDAEAWAMSLPLPTAKETLSQPVQLAPMQAQQPQQQMQQQMQARLVRPLAMQIQPDLEKNTCVWDGSPSDIHRQQVQDSLPPQMNITQDGSRPRPHTVQSQPNDPTVADLRKMRVRDRRISRPRLSKVLPAARCSSPPMSSNNLVYPPISSRAAPYYNPKSHTMSHAYASMPSYSTGGAVQQPPLSLPTHSYSQFLQPIRPSSGAWNPLGDRTLMAARKQGMNWAPISRVERQDLMSAALYAESSPASNSVGELWLKALKTLALDSDGAAKFLQACLDSNGVCHDDLYSTTPTLNIKTWSADKDGESLTISCYLLPGAEKPVQQIVGILNVMEQTLGFKSGMIVWPCLTTAAKVRLSHSLHWFLS